MPNDTQALAPVVPRKSGWQLTKEALDHGGPGQIQFAITNICNAKCDFCNFAVDRFDHAHWKSVTLQQARDVIDIAVRNHIGYMLFVGGEPLAHKDIRPMIRYAAAAGIRPMVCTNGSLWDEQDIRNLVSDGLSSVVMSVDAHDAAKHEKNRGLPRVCAKIKEANRVLKLLGIQSTASITVSHLIEDYDKLPAFLNELGFSRCTFSYPLTKLASSYLSFSDSKLVDHKTEDLIGIFDKIKALKKKGDVHIENPFASLTDMQRHLRGEKEQFGCLGGHKYFYLDWNLNLYRCHYWESPMCSIYDFDQTKIIRDGCTRCMIDCYRDPSVLQHIAIAASDTYNGLKKGDFAAAGKAFFDKRNLTSLKTIWQERSWIGNI